jgi:hypothetical protein
MSAESERSDPMADVAAVAEARDRLDSAIVGYNRHANLVEDYRLAVLRFQSAVHAFEKGVREREAWRESRAAADLRRSLVRAMRRDYVHRLRDEGVGPERVLVAVKRRILLSDTLETPAAPYLDTDALQHDASAWVIAAYYEAA